MKRCVNSFCGNERTAAIMKKLIQIESSNEQFYFQFYLCDGHTFWNGAFVHPERKRGHYPCPSSSAFVSCMILDRLRT